jgi:hypothetical protein
MLWPALDARIKQIGENVPEIIESLERSGSKKSMRKYPNV